MEQANQKIKLWKNGNVEDELDLSGLELTSLPDLPANLKILNCGFNKLIKLPKLPDTLLELYCGNNKLTSLPDLPKGLQTLVCNHNELTSLPELPNGLQNLNCKFNKLTSLPDLPNSLQELVCYQNELTNLPELPNTLEILDFETNRITNLPILPRNLKHLVCHTNPINLKDIDISVILKNIDTTKSIDGWKTYLIDTFGDKTIDINKFNLFHKDNISKCFMPNPVNYPINHSNLKLWLDKITYVGDLTLTHFGYQFVKTLTHISFSEFYDSCCKLSFNILEIINNLNNLKLNSSSDKQIIFYVDKPSKSSFWVLMLMWKFISDKVDILLDDFNELYKYVNLSNDKSGSLTDNSCNYYLFYLDDCSYSGNQIIKIFDNENFYYNKYLYPENIYICCPYMSVNSIKRFEDVQLNVLYTHLVSNFQLDSKMLDNKRYNKLFLLDQAENICNIYFDHKLASAASTFQGIIAFGLYFKPEYNPLINKIMYINPIPLIKGCENVYTADKLNYLYDGNFDLQKSLKDMCPPAFYKTIKYSIEFTSDINSYGKGNS